jgi:hypothetical protein
LKEVKPFLFERERIRATDFLAPVAKPLKIGRRIVPYAVAKFMIFGISQKGPTPLMTPSRWVKNTVRPLNTLRNPLSAITRRKSSGRFCSQLK